LEWFICAEARYLLLNPARLRREFAVNRDQGVFAAVPRPIVAYEPTLGPNDDMTRSPVTKDEHRADGRRKLIVHGKTFEPVTLHEFVTRLRGVIGPGVGIDYARFNQRVLYILPASRFGAGIRTFLGNRGSAPQPGIETGVDRRIGMNYREIPIVTDNSRGSGRPVEIAIIEAGPRRREPFGSHFHCGSYQRAGGQKNKQEKTMHALCVCKARTTLTSLFSMQNRSFFEITIYRLEPVEL
jgi:hypothetical protein